ncbi:hypothetical protein RvY_16132 [Ramazzottius varieornatus]|uniref:SEA domain-containing protein n=1 Tax=Ramazzottius varieornatus TaxID=947166 RepID=A0A1D1VXD4_RAMVA|nr:hypothetical protein RvY_16132 [Ramazzottius varieornatus]
MAGSLSLAATLCVVLLSGMIVSSYASSSYESPSDTASDSDAAEDTPSSGNMKSFSFMDKVLMTYATSAERDVLIQQIQVVWSNTLVNLYQATTVTVTFVRERVVVTSSGVTRNEVTFRVSGRSRATISISAAKSEFRRSFSASPIRNVEIITETTIYTYSTTSNAAIDMNTDAYDTVAQKKTFNTKKVMKTVKKIETQNTDEADDEPVRMNVGGSGRGSFKLPKVRGTLDHDVGTTYSDNNEQSGHDMSDTVKKEEVNKTFKKVTTNVDTIDTNNDGFANQKVVKKMDKTKNVKVSTVEDNTDDNVDAAPAPHSIYHPEPATKVTYNGPIRPQTEYPYQGVPYWLRKNYHAAYTNNDNTQDDVAKADVVKTSKKTVGTGDIDNANDNVDTVKKVSVMKKTFKKTTVENVDSDNDGVADVVKKTVVKTKKVKVDKAQEQTYDENSDDSAQDATTPKYFDTFPNVQHGYSAPKVKVSTTSSDDMKTGQKVDVVKTSFKKMTTDTVDNNDDGVADRIVKKTFTKKTKIVDVEEDVDDNADAAPQTTHYTAPKSTPKVSYVSNNNMDADVGSMKKVEVKKTSFKKVSTDSVDDDDDGVADETVKKTFTKKTKKVSVEKVEDVDDNADGAPQPVRYTAPKLIVKLGYSQPAHSSRNNYFKSTNANAMSSGTMSNDDHVDTVKKVDVVKTSKKVTKVENVDGDNDGQADEEVVKKTVVKTKKVTKTEDNVDDNIDTAVGPVNKVYSSFNRASGNAMSSSNNKQMIDTDRVDSSTDFMTASSQAIPVNAYIIYDTLNINSKNNDEIEAYIQQIESTWNQVIGKNSYIHLSIYDNQTSASSETIKYLVVIFSNVADLDLVSLKSQFYAIKPAPSMGGQTVFTASAHSNAVVLRDTITFSYKSEQERDDFVDGIEKLWQSALGGGFQLVEAWLFDELIIGSTSDTSGKTTSLLSYAVVIVSDKYQLSVTALQASFQQFVITKSVYASRNAACGFQAPLAA